MKKLLLLTALACFSAPAFALNHDRPATAGSSPLASSDEKAKRATNAKIGGLLNTGVTPEQAKRVTEETNRQIIRREKSKTPR